MVRNPKQVDSNLYDCRPQTGKCPIDCSQCFYNRPNAFYTDINEPNIPDPADVGNGIVRMNCGHDSNLQRELVIATAGQYKNFFFNTSVRSFNFPGPVVFTVNPKEEETSCRGDAWPSMPFGDNLMFVRIRLSASNLGEVHRLVTSWTLADVPIVITFMAYYDDAVCHKMLTRKHAFYAGIDKLYELKTRHINEYWCPTREMKIRTMKSLGVERNRLLTMCGTFDSNYCKDCRNCESYYWITRRRLDAIKAIEDVDKGD